MTPNEYAALAAKFREAVEDSQRDPNREPLAVIISVIAAVAGDILSRDPYFNVDKFVKECGL